MTLDPGRVGRITGSRISSILGLNKYQSRDDVLRDMVREFHGAESEFSGNDATRFGQAHESDALTAYEQREGVMVHSCQQFVIHPAYGFLAVTVDGLLGRFGLAEVKAPFRAGYTHISERPDYEVQIRLQLECTQRIYGVFIVWRDGDICTSMVEHDPDWLPSHLSTLSRFVTEYEAVIADEGLSAPFLAPKARKRKAA